MFFLYRLTFGVIFWPETQMRIVATVASIAFVGLAAIPFSGQAAPTAPAQPSEVKAATEFTLVRGGCGLGWHRQGWRGRFGHWHVRCVPNR
jgi:hypothetical protein